MENNSRNAWDRVQLARHPKRPTALKLIKCLFPDFIELKGDRLYKDDFAIVAGISTFYGNPITIIAEEKGISTEDKIKRNFGMPHPEGYHKSMRLVRQAEKFNRPILFIIDTPGAYPGIGAEERGQAVAIANSLSELMTIKVPIISLVLSEGGSGGALAIGVADKVFMFENATYSILSPEGFASILFKDVSKAQEAAEDMRLTAPDLLKFGVIDLIIPESSKGLHEESESSFTFLKELLKKEFEDLQSKTVKSRLNERYKKYRKFGLYSEE